MPVRSGQSDPQPDADAAAARWQRIAIAAFYRAEARGFAPGRELDDWLEAEREIDALERAHAEGTAAAAAHGNGEAGSGNGTTTTGDGEATSEPGKAQPRKRAAGKRTRTTRGATMQARNTRG